MCGMNGACIFCSAHICYGSHICWWCAAGDASTASTGPAGLGWDPIQTREFHPYPLHSIFFDVCFKLRHMKKQNKSFPLAEDTALPPNHQKFVPNQDVLEFIKRPENQAPGDSLKDCSTFDVDKELGFVSKKFDITGLGGAFCRHGFCGLAMNIFTGERYAYALMILQIILFQHKLPLQFFWYDVNCRFKVRFKWWVLKLQEMGVSLPTHVHNISFPLPPFHLNAHVAKCQELNSCSGMKSAARPPGEPTEQKWSILRYLGMTTQYMTRCNREATIERKLHCMQTYSVVSGPALLMRMGARAVEQVS